MSGTVEIGQIGSNDTKIIILNDWGYSMTKLKIFILLYGTIAFYGATTMVMALYSVLYIILSLSVLNFLEKFDLHK